MLGLLRVRRRAWIDLLCVGALIHAPVAIAANALVDSGRNQAAAASWLMYVVAVDLTSAAAIWLLRTNDEKPHRVLLALRGALRVAPLICAAKLVVCVPACSVLLLLRLLAPMAAGPGLDSLLWRLGGAGLTLLLAAWGLAGAAALVIVPASARIERLGVVSTVQRALALASKGWGSALLVSLLHVPLARFVSEVLPWPLASLAHLGASVCVAILAAQIYELRSRSSPIPPPLGTLRSRPAARLADLAVRVFATSAVLIVVAIGLTPAPGDSSRSEARIAAPPSDASIALYFATREARRLMDSGADLQLDDTQLAPFDTAGRSALSLVFDGEARWVIETRPPGTLLMRRRAGATSLLDPWLGGRWETVVEVRFDGNGTFRAEPRGSTLRELASRLVAPPLVAGATGQPRLQPPVRSVHAESAVRELVRRLVEYELRTTSTARCGAPCG